MDAAMINLDPLTAVGLDLHGVIAAEVLNAAAPAGSRPEDLLAGCQSVVVIGSGGDALWRAFLDDLRAHPERTDADHPLDDFVDRAITALPVPGAHRWVTSTLRSTVLLDFRKISVLAGLGVPSHLGMLVHPKHGPWLGLRAALLTEQILTPTGPLAWNPCSPCIEQFGTPPCAAACIGSAFRPSGWDVLACIPHRGPAQRCASGCASRTACVLPGTPYPPEEQGYHSNPSAHLLRAALRNSLS